MNSALTAAARTLSGPGTARDGDASRAHPDTRFDGPAQLTLRPAAVARALGIVAVLLVIANLVALFATSSTGRMPQDVKLAYLFYLDGERNVPTAFAVFLLLSSAVLLSLVTALERQRGAPVLHWALLALGFLAMAFDEAWSFHERLNAPVRAALGNRDLGIFYYGWVAPALALVAILGTLFLRFLWRLPARTRWQFLIAGAVYVGGAVGIELIEGRFDEVHGDQNLISGLTATVQESMELGGVIVFIWALLGYLRDTHGGVRLSFGDRERKTST